MVVHTGTEINEPFRALNQRSQDVGRQRVDSKNMWQAICGDAVSLTIANCRIVNHCIETTQRIDLRGDLLCTRNGLDIANHDCFGLG